MPTRRIAIYKPPRSAFIRECVRLRMKGRTYSAIAKQLGIRIETVRRYLIEAGAFDHQPRAIKGRDGKLYPPTKRRA